MLAELSALETTVLRDVDAALDPLRRKQRDLQAFMASQLERLEMQAVHLNERELEVDRKAAELTKQRASLDEEWTHLDELVETAQANALEMRQERQRLEAQAREQHEAGGNREVRRLRDQIDQLTQERNVLEGELSSAHRKIGQLADVAVELAEARAELERIRSEPARIDAAALTDLQQRLAHVTEERDRLANDVRRVKQHESEMQKQHEAEARKFGEERIEWLAELRSMRRSLEQNGSSAGDERETNEGPNRTPRPSADNKQFDQMLDQIEAVKRDVANRRPRKST